MLISDSRLEIHFGVATLGVSARRIWEHLNLRQVNPFRPITPHARIHAEDYLDVIYAATKSPPLTGVTLADLAAGKHRDLIPERGEQLLKNLNTPNAQRWLNHIGRSIEAYTERRSVRNVPAPFLPADHANPLGIHGLRHALLDWLKRRRQERATAEQWIRRINNLQERGLRKEELTVSGVERALLRRRGKVIDGDTVIRSLAYDDLRLSVVPMLRYSGAHVNFANVRPGAIIKRIKPKLKRRLETRPQWRDPVLGYWIDVVDWDDLLGQQRGWIAFTCRGELLTSRRHPSGLCESPEQAMKLADNHAARIMPKMSTQGEWSKFSLTGGEQYREWLVTLPYLKSSYYSSHFDYRNVLLHVRCDVRETEHGDRVLVLQEVQSDWAQAARRLSRSRAPLPQPPWLREWPALALKLVLLHAAHLGVSGLAWTPGKIQKERYGRHSRKGLVDLYDRTLPRELNRLLRPHGKECETIDVYVPVNFSIEPEESGYIVKDSNGEPLGTAESWVDVQQLLPDGAHEVLTSMHGIRLDQALRERIDDGFYAWGMGIG